MLLFVSFNFLFLFLNANLADFINITAEIISSSSNDVSILVTEPSPEAHPINSPKKLGEPTLVHVLVHRESEEYNTDLEDNNLRNGLWFFKFNFFLI